MKPPPIAPPRMSSNSAIARIGIVSALQRNNDRASARVAGFRRALAENGIELPSQWHVEVPYTLDDAREAARYLLSLEDRPTAVVCGNDVIAYGVLLEAERSGFSVPRDLSVVGFDDLDWSRHLRPSLTTIHVPTGETWQRAGEYLVRQLAGEQTIMHHEIDYSLVVRESTAAASEIHEGDNPDDLHFLARPRLSCRRDRRRRRHRRRHQQSILRSGRDGDRHRRQRGRPCAHRCSSRGRASTLATLDVTDDAAVTVLRADGTSASTRWSTAPAFSRATRNLRSRPS